MLKRIGFGLLLLANACGGSEDGGASTGGSSGAGAGGSGGSSSGGSSSGGVSGGGTSSGGTSSGGVSGGGTSNGGAAGAAGSAGTGGTAECGSGSVCRAAAPAGWIGPLVFYSGSAATALPDCPASMPDTAVDAFDGLSGDPAICNCSCSGPTGSCSGNIVVGFASMSSSGTCSLCSGTVSTSLNTCQATSGSCSSSTIPTGIFTGNLFTNPGTGSCSPVDDVVPPLPGKWSLAARACGTSTPGASCSAGSCVPEPAAPFLAVHCVAQAGDNSCPAGPYANKTVVYQNMQDTRGCASCTCGAATGTSCSTKLEVYDNSTCGTLLQSTAPVGCYPWPTFASSLMFKSTLANGSCTPSAGAPTGELQPTEPTTLCCTS